MFYLSRLYIFLSLIIIYTGSAGQQPATDTAGYKTVVAQSSFQKKSGFYQWLWGRNRRAEWATPIRVPLLWLDKSYGGLKPYQTGGGNETKSLRLQNGAGKEYVLRSINKSRDDVVPPDFKKTFVEDIIKDGISTSHPYSGLALSAMQEQAGIYHTLPILVYLPQQAALDTFNNKYGNDLYLFEQRPDGNWSEAANLGHFKDFSSTANVMKKLQEDNRYKADQRAFVKARLFDMLIGDWDRHEDNWRWGKGGKDGKLYSPVPRDRDQAFYTHNGVLLNLVLNAEGFYYMQNFGYTARDIKFLNMEERNMDRFFTNELSLDDWVNAAGSLQQSLTDEVIEASVQQLPPEIFAVSGKELIEKLKSRRKQLVDLATSYYLFVAREVEIIGTSQREYFDVKKESSGEVSVSAYRLNSLSKKEDTAYYKRTFKPAETKEIRIYGIDGEDQYTVSGSSASIILRIIGGPAKDSVIQSGSGLHIYDDRKNSFQTHSARLHLSSRNDVHTYVYESYHYDSSGFSPGIIGLNYYFKKYKWRRDPFANQHVIGANYSVSHHAFSASYAALYPKLIGHWDLSLKATWDAVRWTNFYGQGNETVSVVKDVDYYRMRSREWLVLAGLHHAFGKSGIDLSAFYQRVKIRDDTDRYVAKVFQPTHTDVFITNGYAGLRVTYTCVSVNDLIVPTKGFTVFASGLYANNFRQGDFFQNYSAKLQTWISLTKKFSLALKAGGTTVVGRSATSDNAQPYEHAIIGGPESLRGFRTERFWGKTSFYNNNELRFITKLRTYLLNAKVGLIAFFDDGRVWVPGENSNILHTAYGGGMLLAPFNRLCLTATYGISNEKRYIQFTINTLL